MNPIKLHYTEPLIRRAVKAFWLRDTGWHGFAALILGLALLIYFVAAGDRSWSVGVLGSVLAMAVIFSALRYLGQYRASVGRFRSMHTPEATLEVGDEKFRMTSDVGSSEMRWDTVTEIWRFPEFWLMFFSRAQFVTLPLTDLDNEARELILDRVKSHGGKVR
jgi:YcxB-like protein